MKRKYVILSVLLAWLCGLACCSLFKPGVATVTTPAIKSGPSVKEQQKVSADANTKYEKQMEALSKQSILLATSLDKTKRSLNVTKKENRRLYDTMDDFIAQKNAAANYKDTAAMVSNCDSIQATVVELKRSDEQKDSLYETAITTLQQQLANKDSVIDAGKGLTHSLQQSLSRSVQQQQALTTLNQQYKKQWKKVKRKQTLTSIGAIVITGLTATYILRN